MFTENKLELNTQIHRAGNQFSERAALEMIYGGRKISE